jgi:hypothetical protein
MECGLLQIAHHTFNDASINDAARGPGQLHIILLSD